MLAKMFISFLLYTKENDMNKRIKKKKQKELLFKQEYKKRYLSSLSKRVNLIYHSLFQEEQLILNGEKSSDKIEIRWK